MKNTCFCSSFMTNSFCSPPPHVVLLQGEDAGLNGSGRLSCSTSIRLCMSQWYVLFKYANVSKNGTRMDDCTVWHLVYVAVKLSYVMSLAQRAGRAERPSQQDAWRARIGTWLTPYRGYLPYTNIDPQDQDRLVHIITLLTGIIGLLSEE